MKKNKILPNIFIVIVIIVWVAVVGLRVPIVKAQTAADLQTQIQELLATISVLQDQINELQNQSSVETIGISISSFTRNLRFGDRGEDVMLLQQILNRDFSTRVAFSGPGSLGEETAFFGNLTRTAVIKFQEKYMNEVLSPVGLSRGSGFVGPSTRAKLNILITKSTSVSEPEKPNTTEEKASDETSLLDVVETVEQASTQTPDIFQEYETLAVSFPSTYEGLPGTEVTLLGIGFERTGNTIHLGSRALVDISSVSGTDIVFTVPHDMSKGKYSLFVSNSKGTSNKTFFIVTGSPLLPRPVIESSTPAEGFYGAEVTITGFGFVSTGNQIRTSYDTIDNVPSPDGTTLTFDVLPYPDIPELQVGVDLGQNIEWPIWFYVVNENGISEEPGKFILKI